MIKYIFEINDSESWQGIKNEISESVRKYVPNVVLNDIQVMKDEEKIGEIYVRIDYSVKEGLRTTNDSIVTKL